MFKAYGFSLSSAFYVGARQGGPDWSDQRLSAIGHYTQLGYVIAESVRARRPLLVLCCPTGAGDDQHDVAGGLNVFFHGHAFKWQTSVSVRFHEGRDAPDMRFQAQLTLAL